LLLNQAGFNANARIELAESTKRTLSFREFCSEMSRNYDKHGNFDVPEQLPRRKIGSFGLFLTIIGLLAP
jgi:hypothetical protein